MPEPTAADRERAERVLSGILDTGDDIAAEFAARVSGECEVDRLMLSDDWNGNWCLECWGGEFNVIDLNNDNEDVIATGPTAIEAIRAALATIGELK